MTNSAKIVPLEGNIRGIIVYTPGVELQATERQALLAAGYVCIKAKDLNSISVIGMPLSYSIDTPTLDAAALAAFQSIIESDASKGPRTLFGTKLASILATKRQAGPKKSSV